MSGTPAQDPNAWMLDGAGEMGALIDQFDWDATPLGQPSSWSHSLRATVAMLLHSRHPMFLWWGAELTQIYNDAYMPSFGVGKHPGAMGQRGRDCWPEIWDIIGPQIDDVMRGGIASWHQDALVPIFRNGGIDEVYWTYGYSPVFDDDGSIGGTLVVCTETTERVLATRQEAALRAEVERDRARLRQFFAQAPAGICIFRGADLTFEFANEHYRALVGGRDIVGKPILVALPELEGQGLDTLLHGVMSSGTAFVGREVPIRVDRHGRGALEDAFYTFIYSPAPGHVGASRRRDCAGARRHRRGAREAADGGVGPETPGQRSAISCAGQNPSHSWPGVRRADGDIGWYNQRWYDYTGTTLESMQGWGWKQVHDPDLLEDVLTQWQAALSAGEPFEMECPLRGRDGQYRWHLTQAMPFKDETGRIVRWFGTNTDIDAVTAHRPGASGAARQRAARTAGRGTREPREGRVSVHGFARAQNAAECDPGMGTDAPVRRAAGQRFRPRHRQHRAERACAGPIDRGHSRQLAHHHGQAAARDPVARSHGLSCRPRSTRCARRLMPSELP